MLPLLFLFSMLKVEIRPHRRFDGASYTPHAIAAVVQKVRMREKKKSETTFVKLCQ